MLTECPICRNYADFFKRDYDSCEAVYHADHCCQCGHLHKSDEKFCEGGECDTFISMNGDPAIDEPKAKPASRFRNFKNQDPLICEQQCGSITYGYIDVRFGKETIVCGGCGWPQTDKYEDYLDSLQYKEDLKLETLQ